MQNADGLRYMRLVRSWNTQPHRKPAAEEQNREVIRAEIVVAVEGIEPLDRLSFERKVLA